MSIHFQTKPTTLFIILILTAFVVNLFGLQTIKATAVSKSELSRQITNQLAGVPKYQPEGNVLSANTKVPFFPRGYVYPIAELGNCDSKQSCFEYCERPGNLDFCAMVSFRNGVMNSDQLKKTLAFSNYLQQGYFESCDSLKGCENLCSDEFYNDQCNLLAQAIVSNTKVLGASDQNSEDGSVQNIFRQCEYDPTCLPNLGSTTLSIVEKVIQSGNAPGGCNNITECVQYCSVFDSIQCNNMLSQITQITETPSYDQIMGRVLSVSEETPVEDIAATTPTYEPQNSLSCMVNSQTNPPLGATDSELTDRFILSFGQCENQYGTTNQQVSNYSNSATRQVSNNMSRAIQCVLNKSSSAEILSCL